jgi:hypothetical protein
MFIRTLKKSYDDPSSLLLANLVIDFLPMLRLAVIPTSAITTSRRL